METCKNMFDSKLPPYANVTSSSSAYPTGKNPASTDPVKEQKKGFIYKSNTDSVTRVSMVNPPHALAHLTPMVVSRESSPQSQNSPDINSEITPPQLIRFCYDVKSLCREDLYLLAVHLDLPHDFRFKLIAEQKANDVYPDESLNTELFKVLTKENITHQQLLVALSLCHRGDLITKYRQRVNIPFNPMPNTNALSCENPHIHRRADDARRSDDYDRSPAGKSQALSDSDLCRIFCGHLNVNTITPEILAQAAGYPELLNDPLLTELKKYQLDKYLLLEKILEKKGQMNIEDVQEILYKPEILDISLANRLDKVTSDQPGNMEKQLHSRQMRADQLRSPQLLGFLSNLVTRKISPDLKLLTLALGMPAFQVSETLKYRRDHAELTTLLDVIVKAQHASVNLTTEHLLYALKESISSDQMADLDSLLQEHPLFKQIRATKPPKVVNMLPHKEVSLPHCSKPLTMSFLSDLPLSHNWFDIGLAMGLTNDELREIEGKVSPGSRAVAFYLSAKLTEPHRKLETGHLFQALKRLNDQATLDFFPIHLSAKPENTLPKGTSQALAEGRSSILSRRQEAVRE